MDYDYPVPDIYECDICPCEPYLPNCGQDQDFTQEQFSGNIEIENRNDSAECKQGRLKGMHLPAPPQKDMAILRKLSITPAKSVEEKVSTPSSGFCPQFDEKDGSRRTFVLTFNDRGDDDCMTVEKNRCKAFWDFVDSEELLQALIKDGEFFFENPPQPVQANRHSLTRRDTAHKAGLKEQQHQFMIRAEKNRAIREEEERRFTKQRQRNLELQLKSGQLHITRKDKMGNNISRGDKNQYADTCEPSFEEVMREMRIFDKLTNNPVKTPNSS